MTGSSFQYAQTAGGVSIAYPTVGGSLGVVEFRDAGRKRVYLADDTRLDRDVRITGTGDEHQTETGRRISPMSLFGLFGPPKQVQKFEKQGDVTALLAMLSDEHARSRRAAVEALGRIEDRAAVHPLVNLLSTETADEVRRAIVIQLIQFGGEEVPGALASVLASDTAEGVRVACAGGLAGYPQRREALDALVHAVVHDTAKAVRVAAALALGRFEEPPPTAAVEDAIRQERVLPASHRHATEDWDKSERATSGLAAARTLAVFGDDELRAAIEDRIGPDQLVYALCDRHHLGIVALEDRLIVCGRRVESGKSKVIVEEIPYRDIQEWKYLGNNEYMQRSPRASSLGSLFVPTWPYPGDVLHLRALVRIDQHWRGAPLHPEILEFCLHKSVWEQWKPYLDWTRARLADISPKFRYEAAEAEAWSGPQTIESFMHLLTLAADVDDGGDHEVAAELERQKMEAARAIAEIGGNSAVDALIQLVDTETGFVPSLPETWDDTLRHVVLEELGELGDPRAVEPLAQVLQAEASRWRAATTDRSRKMEVMEARSLCYDAAKALGKIGDPRAVEPLTRFLEDLSHHSDVWGLRKAAQKALKRCEASPGGG